MKKQFSIKYAIAHFMLLAVAATGSAFADPPPWAGGGQDKHRENADRADNTNKGRDDHRDYRDDGDHRDGGKYSQERRGDVRERNYFDDHHRTLVHQYYEDEYRKGHCPPGLAKKHNGCMPPGQAKKWTIGRPLPEDVRYYSVPNSLVVEIGRPPSGYRYVRVASDILLIAVGSGMVVDAIQDLGRH